MFYDLIFPKNSIYSSIKKTIFVLLGFCLFLVSNALEEVSSQQVNDPVLGVIDLQFVKQQSKQLAGKKDIPEEVLNLVLDHYKQSETYLKELKQKEVLLNNVKTAESKLTEVVSKLRKELQQPGNPGNENYQSLDLVQLEKVKNGLNQSIVKLRNESNQFANARSRRRQELSHVRSDLHRLENLRITRIGDRSPKSGDPILLKAWTVEKLVVDSLIQKTKEYQLANKGLFDKEVADELYVLSKQSSDKNLRIQQSKLAKAQKQIEYLRQVQAKRTEQEVKKATENDFPELAQKSKELRKLAEESVELSKKLNDVDAEKAQTANELQKVKDTFELTKLKVDAVGLTPAIGKLLRKQRLTLKAKNYFSLLISSRGTQIDDAQYKRLIYEDRLGQLGPEAQYIKSLVASGEGTKPGLIDGARQLWNKEKQVLSELGKNYNRFFEALVELDTKQQELSRTSSNFSSYIDRRVLWIPSGKPLYQSFQDDGQALWIWNPINWSKAFVVWWADLKAKPAIWLLLGTILAVLFFRNGTYHQRITLSGKKAKARHCIKFRPTWNALFHTLLISTKWPILIFFLGWRLLAFVETDGSSDLSDFDRLVVGSVGAGLKVVAAVFLPLECLRYLCRRDGLGQAHFSWQESSSEAMKRLLGQLRFVGLPILFLACALHHSTPQFGNDLAGRVTFILGMFLLVGAIYRTFAPSKGILHTYYARHAGGWLDRLQYLWFSGAVFFPAALVVLAVVGYYYTAWHLSMRLYYVFLLVLILLFLQELVARLILISGRKSLLRQAKARRKQAAEQQSGLDEELAAAMLVDDDDWSQEVKKKTVQSNNLLNGLVALSAVFIFWSIWSDVVPALRVVSDQILWTTTETVAQVAEATGSKGPQVVSTEVLRIITPADILQTVGIVLLSIIVFRNLPGLIDILVLNRLPIDESTQIAITSICSYAVIIVGTIFSARQMGIHWNGVQWLVTALTFGLAFGLQEIFANFVAGIILMFERPIRVGDVVTIGDVTGVVVKTRARATTIRNWDLKELIVPNREFITGRVLNWTLSDRRSRIVINVGVAYGTDTKLVHDRLVAVALSHPVVLESPAPMATMESFGDSTLDFVLRAYVGTLGDRLRVTSELHQAIEKDFSKNGIEIAFPQLDVNLPDTITKKENR